LLHNVSMKKTLHSKESELLVAKVIEWRKKAGFKNQREFAKALKVANGTVAKIELGERRIDFVEFFHICKTCGVDPSRSASKLMREFGK